MGLGISLGAKASSLKKFPTFVASSDAASTAVNNTKSITLPAGIQAGDYIVICIGMYQDSGIAVNVPSGYTSLTNQATGRTAFRTVYKVASGSESSTVVNITGSTNNFCGIVAYVIRGASAIEAATPATAASGAPNCPSFSPSWGADSNMWLAAMMAYGTTTTQSAPAGYGDLDQGLANSSGIDWARVIVTSQAKAAGTEDPAAYSTAIGTSGITSPAWYGATIALKPE